MSAINNFQKFPGVYAIKPHKAVQRQPIFIDDAYRDYILDEIKGNDHIEYERQIHNDDK